MAFRYGAPFRLLDLPAEIRNKIYQHMLCSFEEPEPELEGLARHMSTRAHAPNITLVGRSINTGLLRTCKQVHREAYDVMVKTNQFVHVEANDIHLADLLCNSQLPIVTMDREKANQFGGYVLSVKLTGPAYRREYYADRETYGGAGPYFSFMILGQHLDRFSRAIDEGDLYWPLGETQFSDGVPIDIVVHPTPPSLPSYKAPLDDFIARTQRSLLQPFRTHIRGVKYATITGSVSEDLADDVVIDMRAQRWPDPDRTLKDLAAKKEKGNEYFRDRKFDMAKTVWTEVTYELDKIQTGPSWGYLTELGGQAFLDRLPELYFLTNLNLAHIFANDMSNCPVDDDFESYHRKATLFQCANFCLLQAGNTIYSAPERGSTWRPTNAQIVKMKYRQALCIRLMGVPELADEAVTHITAAWHLAPRDETVVAEKENVLAWMRQTKGEVPLLGL
jgi:hypothetical protein